MSLRPLCTACQHLARFRRCYASQAVLLRVPNTERYGEQDVVAGSSTGLSTLTSHPNEYGPSPHDDVLQQTRAETHSGEISHPRNPLAPNKVDLYLASLRTAKLEPTLADIERCRPRGHSDPSTPQYEQDYNTLSDSLCRSFSKAQLRRFAELYNLPRSRSMRKLQYIESIIEKQWKWPSLKDIERMKKDTTEVSVHSFKVSPSQLFLILGKDGADLLQLAIKYNVHISLTSEPLALKVEGLRGSLKKLTEHISRLQTRIIEEMFELPTRMPIRPDLLQRISRLSGAFIENVGSNGKVRICVKDPRNLVSAKRHATRAACESSGSHLLSLYAPLYIPSPAPVPTALYPDGYALFPFSSPRPSPWTMGSSSFRIRRVGEWLGVEPNEDIQKTGGLAHCKGRILTVAQQTRDLKEFLLSNNPVPSSNTATIITASVGHLLLTPPTNAQRPSIISPLKEHLPQSKILKWLHDNPLKSIFLPSLPYSLLNTMPSRREYHHRLIYHTLPTPADDHINEFQTKPCARKVIKYEIALPQPKSRYSVQESIGLKMGVHGLVAQNISAFLNPDQIDIVPISPPPDSVIGKVELYSRCWSGSRSIVNVMMPDRPYDVQFSVFNSEECDSSQEPTELRDYLSDLQQYLNSEDSEFAQPDPPLTISHHGETYVLHTSSSVRQCIEPLSTMATPELTTGPSTRAIVERISDLESHHKSVTCQVICHDHDSEEAWRAFLSSCDHLTTTNSRRQVDDPVI